MAAQFVSMERTDGALFARVVPSKVTEREAGVIQNEIAAAAEPAGWNVAVDLADVSLLASAGLGTLLTLNKSCRAGGGRLVVFNLRDDIRGMMKISRLDRVLDIRPDRAAAMQCFR